MTIEEIERDYGGKVQIIKELEDVVKEDLTNGTIPNIFDNKGYYYNA